MTISRAYVEHIAGLSPLTRREQGVTEMAQTLLALDKAARAVWTWNAELDGGLCGWSGAPAGIGEGECGCDYCALRECLLSEETT